MIYRVHFTFEAGTSHGYGYYGTRAEAERAIHQYVSMEGGHDDRAAKVQTVIRETPRSKAGLLALLNRYGAHAENG